MRRQFQLFWPFVSGLVRDHIEICIFRAFCRLSLLISCEIRDERVQYLPSTNLLYDFVPEEIFLKKHSSIIYVKNKTATEKAITRPSLILHGIRRFVR